MPERYSTGRDPRRDAGRPVRSAARPGSAPRSNYGARPQGNRPAQGSRPAQGNRPAGNRAPQGYRPAPRRRKKKMQPRFFIVVAAVIVALVVALILIFSGGKGTEQPVQAIATPEPVAANGAPSNVTMGVADPAVAADPNAASTGDAQMSMNAASSDIAAQLNQEGVDPAPLSEEDRVKVSDLSINTSLPQGWTNILLLGTDERTHNESARTDTMIICSISDQGEVKLTSIMRDLAVKMDELGDNSGTYRINDANFWGGPEYAMKVVNECFGMNIQYYATVNFFGFQKIAEALGGIEVDITEAERDEINQKLLEQYRIARAIGEDMPTVEEDYLHNFGPNTHLNGHQTLAYARVRKSDGSDSDFTRAERQRTVLVKLMEKLKGRSAVDLMAMVSSLSQYVTLNMDIEFVLNTATKVLNSGFGSVETLRLPVPNSYTEERRNDKAMLYDCDWATNSMELQNFIYA